MILDFARRSLRRIALLTVLLALAALALPRIARAVTGGDFTAFATWVQVHSSPNGYGQGGLSIGPSKNDVGTKITRKYACQVALDVPSLATTCTSDTFQLNSPGGSFSPLLMPDGSSCSKMFTDVRKGDECYVTMGTNATEAYSQSCSLLANSQVTVRSCTYGTVNPATQNVLLSVTSYK